MGDLIMEVERGAVMDSAVIMQALLVRLSEQSKLVERFLGTGCEGVADYLAKIASLRGDAPSGYAFASPERLLLERGRAFERKPLPDGIEWGPIKRCFDNARDLAMNEPDRFAYCEGWAFPGSGIAVHHAWALDLRDGLAVDTTWRPKVLGFSTPQYVGLPFALDHMLDALNRSGTVLDDHAADHPILTGTVPDEDWLHPCHSGATPSCSASPGR